MDVWWNNHSLCSGSEFQDDIVLMFTPKILEMIELEKHIFWHRWHINQILSDTSSSLLLDKKNWLWRKIRHNSRLASFDKQVSEPSSQPLIVWNLCILHPSSVGAVTSAPSDFAVYTCRIIPVSKWLVTSIYTPWMTIWKGNNPT